MRARSSRPSKWSRWAQRSPRRAGSMASATLRTTTEGPVRRHERVAPGADASTSSALYEPVEARSPLQPIRVDDRTGFTIHALAQWDDPKNHCPPSRSTRQTYPGRLCRTLQKTCRTELLGCYVFDSLQEVKDITEDGLHRYSHHRPHESLTRIPPIEYCVTQFPTPLLTGSGV